MPKKQAKKKKTAYDDETVLKRFQEDLKASKEGRRKTIEKGRESRKMYDGHQWHDKDKAALEERGGAAVSINEIKKLVRVVQGMEILNHNEPRYLPRTVRAESPLQTDDDTREADIATEASRYFRGECNAATRENKSFGELLVEGMGWTRTRIEMEEDPEGSIVVERVDPEKIFYDPRCEEDNFLDGGYVICRELRDEEAFEDLYPGKWQDLLSRSAMDPTEVGTTRDSKPTADYDDEPEIKKQLRKGEVYVYEYQFWTKETYYQWEDPEAEEGVGPGELSPGQRKKGIERFEQMLEQIRAQLSEIDEAAPVGPGSEDALAAADAKKTELAYMAAEYEDMLRRFEDAEERRRKCYWQAFIAGGMVVRSAKKSPCQVAFTYQGMSGDYDKTDECFNGFIEDLKDPQRILNKTISLTLDILMTTPQAGYLAEEGAVNAKQFEDSIAAHDEVTYVPPGSLSEGKIEKKQPPQLSPVLAKLQAESSAAIANVSGVNPELMGVGTGANTPVGTTMNRTKMGYTTLASYFDRLSLYRREQGKVQLDLMRHLPSRLIRRITGDRQDEWIYFRADEMAQRYDVIVDEAPSSPNQQEEIMRLLEMLIPILKGAGVPPQFWALLVDYVPAPAAFKADLKKMFSQPPAPPPRAPGAMPPGAAPPGMPPAAPAGMPPAAMGEGLPEQ